MDVYLGENPFLTVTEEELDYNIKIATLRLKSVRDTKEWRQAHHYCVVCGVKLPLGCEYTKCERCDKKKR